MGQSPITHIQFYEETGSTALGPAVAVGVCRPENGQHWFDHGSSCCQCGALVSGWTIQVGGLYE